MSIMRRRRTDLRHGEEVRRDPLLPRWLSLPSPAVPLPLPRRRRETEFTVVLKEYPADKKVSVIKVVRELTGLGLKEAKDLVEACRAPSRTRVDKADSRQHEEELEEAGAKVEIK
jgi:large subunit ribosomal protein L7/L12